MADDKLAKNSSGTCNDIDNLEAELTRLIYSMPNAELDPSQSGKVIELQLKNPECSHFCYLIMQTQMEKGGKNTIKHFEIGFENALADWQHTVVVVVDRYFLWQGSRQLMMSNVQQYATQG